MNYSEFRYILGDIFIDKINHYDDKGNTIYYDMDNENYEESDCTVYYKLKSRYGNIRDDIRSIYISKRFDGLNPKESLNSTLKLMEKFDKYFSYKYFSFDMSNETIKQEIDEFYNNMKILYLDILKNDLSLNIKNKYLEILNNLSYIILNIKCKNNNTPAPMTPQEYIFVNNNEGEGEV